MGLNTTLISISDNGISINFSSIAIFSFILLILIFCFTEMGKSFFGKVGDKIFKLVFPDNDTDKNQGHTSNPGIANIDKSKRSVFGININSHIDQSTNLSLNDITQFTGKSPDYNKLISELEELNRDLEDIPATNIEGRIRKSKAIQEKREIIEAFKRDVLRLARTFETISINTDRLRKAKEFFENGDLQQANDLLIERDLCEDQKNLFSLKKILIMISMTMQLNFSLRLK